MIDWRLFIILVAVFALMALLSKRASVCSMACAVVLAAENGRAWALRAGNLTIVSRTPDKPPVNRADDFLRYLSEFPD